MTQWRMVVSILVGGILLTLPTTAAARCSGSGPTFRCDPIVSESLRRKSQGLSTYTPSTPKSYKYRGNTYVTPRGSVLHRYKYKSPSGRSYKGTIKSLPGGSYSHKGRWK